MSDRLVQILKLACVVIAALLVVRAASAIGRARPLAELAIPDVPTWSPPEPTNSPAPPPSAGAPPRPGMPMPGMPGGMLMPGMPMPGMPGGMAGGPPLPPAVQKRLDRIVESGLLGPIIRPPPMALLGIAGPDVFLRAPDGQTGMIREGGELGGVKLLRIGTNRVLVLEKGQTNELSIFGGLGGDSLLPSSPPPQP